MNKPKFKCLMALLCLLLGVVLLLTALLLTAFSSTTYTLLLAFGGILVVIGGIAYYINYQAVKIITRLKTKQLPILAHWTYIPTQFDTIRNALIEEKHNNLSIIILTAFLALLIDMGFILSNPSIYFTICIILGIIIILFATICSLGILFYYKHKLSHPVEAIISEAFIYFCGEFYGLNRSLYVLESVQILEGHQSYLQFIYGSPGTPYDPIYILTIPIPTGNLELAHFIKMHFTKLLEN